MRTVALVMLAACSEPTGLAQSWPPTRGVAVEAVVGQDLDADGVTDVLVYSSGDMHRAGIYRLEGGVDLALGAAQPVLSFSTFVALPLGHPSAGAIATVGGMPTVVAAFVGSEVDVDALDAGLVAPDETLTDLPPGNAVLWVRTLTFPGGEQRIVVSNGTAIEHDSFTTIDTQSLPPPDGQAWSGATVATTFAAGSGVEIAVATPTQVVSAPVTSTNTNALTWTTVRDGPTWLGQVAVNLGGLSPDDSIVGLDLAQHAVCAIDPNHGTPLCLDLGTISASSETRIMMMRRVTGINLVITQSDDTMTAIKLVESVRLTSSALLGDVSELPTIAIGHGRPVAVSRYPNADPSVLVFGSDGSVVCELGC